mmetsp:Transcript_12274/g.28907  ORF Transcript_12274/g.28907 Transcript_12274/m.28907 type:complete len:280 (+) Transcript_12274:5294-6133(+)
MDSGFWMDVENTFVRLGLMTWHRRTPILFMTLTASSRSSLVADSFFRQSIVSCIASSEGSPPPPPSPPSPSAAAPTNASANECRKSQVRTTTRSYRLPRGGTISANVASAAPDSSGSTYAPDVLSTAFPTTSSAAFLLRTNSLFRPRTKFIMFFSRTLAASFIRRSFIWLPRMAIRLSMRSRRFSSSASSLARFFSSMASCRAFFFCSLSLSAMAFISACLAAFMAFSFFFMTCFWCRMFASATQLGWLATAPLCPWKTYEAAASVPGRPSTSLSTLES